MIGERGRENESRDNRRSEGNQRELEFERAARQRERESAAGIIHFAGVASPRA